MSHLLFVCTANICRSPAAEAIAQTRFGFASHQYSSAGFMYEGRPATPEMVKTLDKIGVDATSHVSRIITPELAADVDLILTMESRHIQDIGIMSTDMFDKTLPLGEAAERLAARRLTVPELTAELKGRNPMAYLDSKWDIEDPYKRSRRKYRKAVAQISDLVGTVMTGLG